MSLMRKTLILSIVVGGLAACQSQPLSFASMSEEELFAYNSEKPLLQQVICVEEQTTSSYIRKRRCQSIEQLVSERTAGAMKLQVLNWGYNYNAGIGRSYD